MSYCKDTFEGPLCLTVIIHSKALFVCMHYGNYMFEGVLCFIVCLMCCQNPYDNYKHVFRRIRTKIVVRKLQTSDLQVHSEVFVPQCGHAVHTLCFGSLSNDNNDEHINQQK